jgi:ribosomal protein S18 acetylase RimI-like enzyme
MNRRLRILLGPSSEQSACTRLVTSAGMAETACSPPLSPSGSPATIAFMTDDVLRGEAVSVVPVSAADREGWLTLWKGYQEFYGIALSDACTEILWARLLDDSESIDGLLAKVDGAFVGVAHCVRHRSTWTADDYLYLHDLYVAPDRRRSGVGRALLSHVKDIAAGARCARVYWLTHESNETARRLYDRVAVRTGFIHYQTRPERLGAES